MDNSQQIFELHFFKKKYMRKPLIFVDHLEMWNLSHNKYLASSLHIRENESRFSEMLCDKLTAGPNKNCSLHNKLKLKYN